MKLDKTGVSEALLALGDHLEQATSEVVEFVVCGGSALQALGLVDRTTKDVDVLAVVKSEAGADRGLLSAQPLPAEVVEAARIVARDLGLPANWLNPGPTELLSQGLPEGLSGRLHTRVFGHKLIVHFVDRLDQIPAPTVMAATLRTLLSSMASSPRTRTSPTFPTSSSTI